MDSSVPIDYEELLQAVKDKKVTVVDVRSKDEMRETGKIPGSVCVPLPVVAEAFSNKTSAKDFEDRFGFPKPATNACGDLVISCRSGRRVGMALAELEKLGYTGCRAYKGSILDWKAHDGPLEPVE